MFSLARSFGPTYWRDGSATFPQNPEREGRRSVLRF